MANIFLLSETGGSDVSMFVDSFYKLLMTRHPISYADVIYHTDSNVPVGYFDNHTISSYDLYRDRREMPKKFSTFLTS